MPTDWIGSIRAIAVARKQETDHPPEPIAFAKASRVRRRSRVGRDGEDILETVKRPDRVFEKVFVYFPALRTFGNVQHDAEIADGDEQCFSHSTQTQGTASHTFSS